MQILTTRKSPWWARWGMGLALVTGLCTSHPAFAADSKSRPAGKTSAKACRTKAAGLSKWLGSYVAGVDRQPAFIALPEEVELLSIDRPTAGVDTGLLATLSPDGTSIEGETVLGNGEVLAGHIREALARQQTVAKLTHQTLPATLLMAVDRRTTWRRVVETVDAAAAAGVDSVQLAFRSKQAPRVAAPGPSAFDRRLVAIREAKPPSDRTLGIANMASTLVSACPPLAGPLTAMAKRGGLVPGDFADALLACDCAADAASLETLIWSVRPPLPGTLLTLVLARDTAQGRPIVASGDLAWSAAHKLIAKAVGQDATKPTRLVVRGGR